MPRWLSTPACLLIACVAVPLAALAGDWVAVALLLAALVLAEAAAER